MTFIWPIMLLSLLLLPLLVWYYLRQVRIQRWGYGRSRPIRHCAWGGSNGR